MPHFFSAILLSTWVLVQANGGTSVIGLVMPPPGGAGSSALQSGSASADGAASLYYNPASLAELSRNTGSQFHFTKSEQLLLPMLGIPDLKQDFLAFSGTLPDPNEGLDVGIGFFRNHINFGKSQRTDNNGNSIGEPYESGESVFGLGIGARLGWPVSLGGTAKYFESYLGSGPEMRTFGWAFDFGMLVMPEILPFKYNGISSVIVSPSLGLVIQNMGPDVFYREALESDPIPTTFHGALGLSFRLADLVELDLGRDVEMEVHRRTDESDRVVKLTSLNLTCIFFTFAYGTLTDPTGKRFENSRSFGLEFNALRLFRLWNRIKVFNFHSEGKPFENGYLFGQYSILGFPFQLNPGFSIGSTKINARDSSLRDGQEAFYMAFTL